MISPFDAGLPPGPDDGYVAPALSAGPTVGEEAVASSDDGMPYTFSMYNSQTGLFTGMTCSGSINLVTDMDKLDPVNSMILGEYDYLSQRVDLETGLVVDYVPPKPGNGYQWFADVKRWRYVANAAESLWDAQTALKQAVNDRCSALLLSIRSTYPVDEVTSWAKQEGEARAYVADPSASTPLLAAIAAARGVPLPLLAARVIEKADLFAIYSGQFIGQRQNAEDRIDACRTTDEVDALRSELFPLA